MRRRLFREPLLRFLVLGAMIFAADRALAARRSEGGDARRIELAPAFVDGLARAQERRTGVVPDARGRAELVRGWVREEVLFREALALGLDRGDPIVRRRLAQKTELWLRTTSEPAAPDDATLAAYEGAHAERYRDEARTSFEHAFFAAPDDVSRAAARARAEAALATGVDASTGDAFAAGRAETAMRDGEVRRLFGDDFAHALAAVPAGEVRWSAPVDGRYGVHLVRVSSRSEARLPPLDEVRARVAADWLEDARREAVDRRIDALVSSYEVVGP